MSFGRRENIAMSLGMIVFSGEGDNPGELLSAIASVRQALDALEARYADLVGRKKPASDPAGEKPTEQRKRGRRPGSTNSGAGRRGGAPAVLPFDQPKPATAEA